MWRELWDQHRGKATGVACGVLLAIIYLIWGFWDMLIAAFIVFVCYTLGKMVDEKQPLPRPEHVVRWLSERWRIFK